MSDGAICGVDQITDGAKCGWDYFECGWDCVWSGFSDCTCSTPKWCSVAKSCYIANTCTVEASCNFANSCDVPASCQKVKSCEWKYTIPDFDFGSVKGKVHVKIGNAGLYGSVTGEYCTPEGDCVTIAGGSVDTSTGAPRACVEIAGLPGEFCTAF